MTLNRKNGIRILVGFGILLCLTSVKVLLTFHPEWIVSQCTSLNYLSVCGANESELAQLSVLDHKLERIKELKDSSGDVPRLYFVKPGFTAFLLGVNKAQPLIHRSSIRSVILYVEQKTGNEPKIFLQEAQMNEAAYQLVQAQVSAYLGSSGYSDVPLWILSGLGRWVSDESFDYNQTLTWLKMADSRITKSNRAEELKAQLIVTYLLERQGESIENLLRIRENPKTIISEMF